MRPVLSEWLDRRFEIGHRGSTPRVEVVAGVTTFMTMAYILIVNPAILSSAGIPFSAAAAATCLGAALPSLLMGWWTNYPLALASGMGINAAVAFHATQPGMTWQTMMGVIAVEGVLITVLVATGLRERVMGAIPEGLKRGIGAGIGLLIAFLGLQQMGWVAKGEGGAFLARGDFSSAAAGVASIGCLILVALMAKRVHGAILIGVLTTTVCALMVDWIAPGPKPMVALPKDWIAMPDFSTFGRLDIVAALKPALFGTIFAFLITDFFDTMGTLIAVGGQGGFFDKQGRLPGLRKVLMVDSLAAVWGGVCGCSSSTTYVESAAGVGAGGRTGLTSMVVGFLFLAALFVTPALAIVPAVATAPALLMVGFLMMRVVMEINFASMEEGLPAFLAFLLIPFSQSISTGIGVGLIAGSVMALIHRRRSREALWLHGFAALFLLDFVLL